MTRRVLAVLTAALLCGPAVAAAESPFSRANEQATEATRGTARDAGKAAEKANEKATETTRGTAKEIGKAAQKAADDLGKAFRELGKKLSD